MTQQEEQEEEANYFARCLLVPREFLLRDIAAMGGQIDISDDDALKSLAKKYGVSLGVMAMRLMDVKND